MKIKSQLLLALMALAVVSFSGCIERHIKAPKFDIYADTIPKFKGDQPVAVIVPAPTGKEYFVEYADPKARHTGKVFVDLDGLHANARELIVEELAKHGIASSPSAARQLKFTITKVQWAVWAGGFSTGAYLDFDIETSAGYKAHHRVQDGSGADLSRAIGGAVSRAVEQVFLDPGVVKFIQGF